jgi:hypothetical protein
MKNDAKNILFVICLLLPLFIVTSCTEQSQHSVSVEETIGVSPEYANYENAYSDLTNFLMNSDFKSSKLHDVMISNGYVSFGEIPQDKLEGITGVSKYFALQQTLDTALDALNQKYDYLEVDEKVRLEIQRVYGAKPALSTTID